MSDLRAIGWLGVGVAADQYAKWTDYKSAVGVENTSAQGFRIWKEQTRMVTSRQPHANRPLMWLTGIAWVFLAYGWLTALGDGGSNASVLGWAFIFTLAAWFCFKHRPRTARWKQEQASVNNWHKAGCPQGQSPAFIRS